jgi:RND family efflux transporter MFP subunit
MKKIYLAAFIAASILTFSSCGNNSAHSEATEEHAGHDHDEDDDHDHDHEAGEEHDHDHDGHEHHPGEIAFSKAQAEAAGLAVENVAAAPFSSVIKSGGQIQAPQGDEQTVVATSAGVVTFANNSISEGMSVRAGETLATVSAKNLQDGDPQVKARIAYETAEKELKRAERLIGDKIISAREYEQARSNYETAKAIYQAQAGSTGANGVRISAGMTGFLKQLLVSQGQYVAVGQPIAVIAQNRRLQLKALVPESRYKQLRTVTSANFKPAYDKETTYKLSDLNGRLISYGKSTSESSAFIPVIFEFDNVGDLIPGSYVDVYLLGQVTENVISVPLSAVTEEQGLYFVYVKIEDEAYVKRQVTLGDNNGERIVIKSGLSEGEPVVVKGAYNVKMASVTTAIPHGHQH